jgi:CheY-like chemotaxis protein
MAYKVLIVDDDLAARDGLAMLLADEGYETLVASTVPAALSILKQAHPDLLITDIRLDEYNGLHLVAMAPRPIPAIVITGFADASVEADARRLGAEFLVKPISPPVLRELVTRALTAAAVRPPFVETRRAGRTALRRPLQVRIGQTTATVLDVSEEGIKLSVEMPPGEVLPRVMTLTFNDSSISFLLRVAWERRQDQATWVCGAAIPENVRDVWRPIAQALASQRSA